MVAQHRDVVEQLWVRLEPLTTGRNSEVSELCMPCTLKFFMAWFRGKDFVGLESDQPVLEVRRRPDLDVVSDANVVDDETSALASEVESQGAFHLGPVVVVARVKPVTMQG
jgi:hypothetical protein